jgi:hypothetical protein
MKEDNSKQNDALKKKIEDEHVLANQQMKDMMFLQQKQNELKEQDEINKKRMADFERVRMMMENNKKEETTNIDQNKTNKDINQNSNVNENVNNILNNAFGGGQRITGQVLADQRKLEITKQLQEMKKNINNFNSDNNEKDNNTSDKSSSASEKNTSSSTSDSNVTPKSKISLKKESNSSQSNEGTTISKNNASTFSKRKYKRSGISIDTA